MKDFNVRKIPKDAVYKNVVIIGNGPSGISLSYMLAGNWPYWVPEKVEKHPDEFLRTRLNYAGHTKSLVEQDLSTLADGLEGRSTNPISLLLDSLEHPCADLGLELPSMLQYKYHHNAQVDHIVLGKGPPGGSWHRMDPNLRTLSLATWMSLPGLSFSDWEKLQLQKDLENKLKHNVHQSSRNDTSHSNLDDNAKILSCQKCMKMQIKINSMEYFNDENSLVNNNESETGALCCRCTKAFTMESQTDLPDVHYKDKTLKPLETTIPPRRNLSLKRQVSKEVQTRALVSRVAQYYEDYVHIMNLDKYFVNDFVVTWIAPLQEDCAQGKFRSARWIVMGVNRISGRAMFYACRNVVLANGASDLANRLGLRGESLNASWVKYDLPHLEAALESLNESERKQLKPVLVVGAGLSAADAVTICRSSDIHVIHVFRSRTAGLDKMLPENVYPEYHEVHRMMRDLEKDHKFYTPIPEHTISDLSINNDGTHQVTVRNLVSGETSTFLVSFCAILIGSKPDLRLASGLTKCPTRSISVTSSLLNEKINLNPNNLTPQKRKLSWLKALCAKSKHLNVCNWGNSRGECRKYCDCLENSLCDCPKCNLRRESEACIADESGLGLGIDPTKPVDCKSNQIAVDKYSNEVLHAPKGLFAMGPLVGDNFVRFIPGGALTITVALHKEND